MGIERYAVVVDGRSAAVKAALAAILAPDEVSALHRTEDCGHCGHSFLVHYLDEDCDREDCGVCACYRWEGFECKEPHPGVQH